jgi:hypothetical protein
LAALGFVKTGFVKDGFVKIWDGDD